MINLLRRLLGKWVGSSGTKTIGADTDLALSTSSGIETGQATVESQPALENLVAFDEDLLEKARTQWQFGDWETLTTITREQLQHHPDKAKIALLVSAGHGQSGNTDSARRFARLAEDWGCSRQLVARVLVSGVYNALARAQLIQGREQSASVLMHEACEVGMPGCDKRLLLAARLAFQAAELGLPQPDVRVAIEAHPQIAQEGSACSKRRLQNRSRVDELTPHLYTILENLTDSVLREGIGMVLDGVRVFDAKDPFRSGKLALAFSYRVIACEPNSPEQLRACREFKQVIEMTCNDQQATWGIYFFLLALVRLKQHGVLDNSVDASRLEQLRQQLDWRNFVEEDSYQIKSKANNFYGVAFGIAEHRSTLGWDDPVHGKVLLQRMLHHYRRHSHPYGFADETEGIGRYDRYSILLIAEIAHRLRETGQSLTPEMQTWLRTAVQFVLVNLNENGDGFQFGRSIGAYGDTAFLEILTAAAWHGVLTQVEAGMAYAFCRRVTRKFLDFWYDDSRQSVNLWEEGRATDGYRSKHRILGENISLLHQHIYTHDIWEQLGFKPNAQLDGKFSDWLAQLPPYTLTRFSNKNGAKAALTVRYANTVFSLWFVNLAEHHANGAYAPAPFSPGLVQAMPGEAIFPLTPILELEDGSQLMPMAYFDDIHLEEYEGKAILSCSQTGMAIVKKGELCHDERASVLSRFVFTAGAIKREDKFISASGSNIAAIRLNFPVLQSARVESLTALLGDQEEITFYVTGYDDLWLQDLAGLTVGDTPQGRIRTYLHATKAVSLESSTETTVSWTLKYKSG